MIDEANQPAPNDKAQDTETRKAIIRPTQLETNYTTVSTAPGQLCANCRWFDARAEYGPYCGLIDNYPLDILATGRCERWELSPLEADIEALEPVSEPEPEVVKYIAPDSNADGFLKALRGKLKRGLKPDASVLKDAHGRRYMLVVTSNSYLDREGETISTEALKSWVDRQWIADDAFHTENKLLFWHDERLELGDIVFADMRGPFLVELAREANTEGARKMFDYIEAHPQEKLGASHRFAFLTHQRDDEGTYHKYIEKRETSILPREVAANALTLSGVIPMASKRDEYLHKYLGLEKEAAEKLDKTFEEIVEMFSANGIEHKAKGDADPEETAKEAVVIAAKNHGSMVVQMAGDLATLLERQDDLETANKALTDENTTLKTKTADRLKAAEDTIAGLQTQLDGRPRQASRAAETEVNKSELSEAAQEAIEAGTTEVDEFWGTKVQKGIS